MSARACSGGCGKVVQSAGYCPECARVREQARGSRQERGYDAAHDRERLRWTPLVRSGNVRCVRCGEPIRAGERWHLDHDEKDRSKYLGPSHESCNTREPRLRDT